MKALIALVHHRWALPVLAELRRREGAKFVTLEVALGASGGGLRWTLQALMAQGLVEPNPGYGHPLRPEYVLTAAGERAGKEADAVLRRLSAHGAVEAAGRKWTLPVTLAIGPRALRFGEVRERLPGITDRALALALKEAAAASLLRRSVRRGWPPLPVYSLTARGRDLLGHLRRLTPPPRRARRTLPHPPRRRPRRTPRPAASARAPR